MIVRIDRNYVCLMLQNNNTPIPSWPPVTENDLSIRSRMYGSSLWGSNINTVVSLRCLLRKTTGHLTL
jgi:hypothetical protein